VSFTTYKFTPYTDHLFPDARVSLRIRDFDQTRGNFVLGPNAKIDVSGLVVDDRPLATDPLSQPQAIDGGSIGIVGFDVSLAKGSLLDASGGVIFARDGRRTYGAGGSIAIRAGNDPKIPHITGGLTIVEKQQ